MVKVIIFILLMGLISIFINESEANIRRDYCQFIYVTTVDRLGIAIIQIQDRDGNVWREMSNLTKDNKIFQLNMKRVMSDGEVGVYINGEFRDGTSCEDQRRR